MKIKPKAPWYVDPGISEETPEHYLYCTSCDAIWELTRLVKCPQCSTTLKHVLPSYPVLSQTQTLVYRYYCDEHGILTDASLIHATFVKGTHEHFGSHCKICKKPVKLLHRRLCEPPREYPSAQPPTPAPGMWRCTKCGQVYRGHPLTSTVCLALSCQGALVPHR